jgi:predicted lactoylglutathione lyase
MRTISVSLPVRNPHASRAFFAELGFRFSAALSGDEIACMIVDQDISVLLVAEDRFRDCADGEIRQTAAAAGCVTGLSAGSEQEVDETVAKPSRRAASRGPSWKNARSTAAASGISMAASGQLTCPRQRQPGTAALVKPSTTMN